MAHRGKNTSHNKKPPAGHPSQTGLAQPAGWGEAVTRFRNHLLGPAEASRYTVDHYGRDLGSFASWWGSAREGIELSPGAITDSDLRDWKEHLRTEPLDPTGRTRKPAAVNAKLAAMRSFLGWARDAGILDQVPTVPKRVKAARPAYKAVPRADQNRLLRAVEFGRVKRDYALVLVLLDCGLRVSELCKLRWRDVEIGERKGDLAVWEGKGRKHRSVPIGKRCRAALRELRPRGVDPNEPVFPSRKGADKSRPLTPRAVQLLLAKYGRISGVKASPHMFRHSCAKDMLDRGNQVTAVQAILGHESVNTTLGYLTSSPEDLRKAVERDGEGDE
jgi:integrase/recombinase XerC